MIRKAKAPGLARFRAPTLAQVVDRVRVTRLLGEATSGAAAWIHAPAGAGKTTAIAGFVRSLSGPVAWLRLDAGDEDPGNLVESIGSSLRLAFPRRAIRLPVYSPEMLEAFPTFARSFARAVYEGTGATFPWVVDDLHRLPDSSPLFDLFAALCEERPPECPLILASRNSPPGSFVGLSANGRLREIGWEALRFSEQESVSALLLRGIDDAGAAARLHRQADGWIAGTLLLAMGRGSSMLPDSNRPIDRESLFDYFATVVLEGIPPEDRNVLLRTCFLGDVSADAAVRLAADTRAPDRLAALAKHNVFTSSIETRSGPWRYHDLFKDFLRRRAEATIDARELRDVRLESARQMQAAGELEEAAARFAECAGWAEVAGIALSNAEQLLATSRHETLLRWIDALPAARREADPWLEYWRGQCLLRLDEQKAEACLETAWRAFEARGDRLGMLLAAADIPRFISEQFSSYASLDRWVSRIAFVAKDARDYPSPGMELRALCGQIFASFWNEELGAARESLAARIESLLPDCSDPNLQLAAATTILRTCWWQSERAGVGERTVKKVADLGIEDRASPIIVVHWLYDRIIVETMHVSPQRAAGHLDRAEEIARETGIRTLLFSIAMARLEVAADARDPAALRRWLAELESMLDPARAFHRACRHIMRARLALIEGRGQDAVAEMRSAIPILDEAGFPLQSRNAWYMAEAAALALSGDLDAARACGRRYEEGLRPEGRRIVRIWEAMIDALRAVRGGDDDEARAALGEALRLARELRYIAFFRHADALAAEICSAACRLGIETDFVTDVVRKRKLAPPDPAQPEWPWPLQVRCLGSFEIVRSGEPVTDTGRSQKTIELLQACIALGGQDVPVEKLVRLLWPGDGREGAQHAFEVTLSRLRKLLGSESALVVSDRQLSVNREEAWIDCQALQSRLDATEALDEERRPVALRGILDLYRGHFLPHRIEAAWAREARERLWGRVRRLLAAEGRRLRAAGDVEGAERVLYAIVDRDPVAEEAFAELMRLFMARGQPGEALRVYERCASALASELGIEPGEELRKLASSLKREGKAGRDRHP